MKVHLQIMALLIAGEILACSCNIEKKIKFDPVIYQLQTEALKDQMKLWSERYQDAKGCQIGEDKNIFLTNQNISKFRHVDDSNRIAAYKTLNTQSGGNRIRKRHIVDGLIIRYGLEPSDVKDQTVNFNMLYIFEPAILIPESTVVHKAMNSFRIDSSKIYYELIQGTLTKISDQDKNAWPLFTSYDKNVLINRFGVNVDAHGNNEQCGQEPCFQNLQPSDINGIVYPIKEIDFLNKKNKIPVISGKNSNVYLYTFAMPKQDANVCLDYKMAEQRITVVNGSLFNQLFFGENNSKLLRNPESLPTQKIAYDYSGGCNPNCAPVKYLIK